MNETVRLPYAGPASRFEADLHPHSTQKTTLRIIAKMQKQAIYTVNASFIDSPIANDCDSAAR